MAAATLGQTGLDNYTETDEYGQPADPTAVQPRYGWLGTHQRDAGNTIAGLTLMGARLYGPVIGRFLSIDPVPGGNDNRYTYPADPVNTLDLDGRARTLDAGGGGGGGGPLLAGRIGGGARVGGGAGAGRALGTPSGGRYATRPGQVGERAVRGETAATKLGRQIHAEWRYPRGYEKEYRLPSGRRIDAINFRARHIIELKPANPRAIRLGQRQVQAYIAELNRVHPGKKPWTGSVQDIRKVNGVRDVVQVVFSDFLKATGFTRKGTSWYRTGDGLITVVNLQKSQYGGKYYVNVALWLLALGEASTPKEYECHVRTRLGNVVSDDDVALERLLDLNTQLTDRDRGTVLAGLLSEYLSPVLEVTSSVDRLLSTEGARFLDESLVVGAADPILGRAEE